MNLPNKLTTLRMCLVPVFILAFYLQPGAIKWIALIVFVVASCTDFMDGYLARKNNLVTDFGKIMDPIADKVLVATALILLTEAGRIPAVVTLIIIAREFLISGMRQIAASHGTVVAAGSAGKWKTATQMIALILLLVLEPGVSNQYIVIGAYVILYISLALTIYSAAEYLWKYRSLFSDR